MESPTKSKGYLAFIALCLSSNALFAQQTRQVSLQEAVQLSLDNNKSLKVSAAKIDQASAELSEAKMNQYPDLKISGSYLRVNQPNIDMKVKLGGSGSGEGSGGSQEIKVDQVAYGMATASVPLFSGLRIRNGIESAKYLKKAAELDAYKDRDEVIQNTVAAYYNLYKAQAAVKLVNENLKQAQQRVKDFSNMEQNGLIARNDLLKVQLQESNVELALVDAENNQKIANFNMNLMLGLDEKTELSLDDSGLGAKYKIQSMEEWETTAIANRADFQALDERQQAAKAGVKAANGGYFPSVALTGGYVAAHIPNFLTVTNAVNVGVGVSYNIASLYKNGAKVKQAKAQQEQLHWSSQEMNEGIRMQIHQAYQNYLESQKKIEVYAKAVEQARENYRITKNKYDNALATTTDLLDADVAQLQAGINYEYAKADAVVAYNKLNETAGLIQKSTVNAGDKK
ncbi:TolC family protein [Taibaiella chishuiensis]|uniref:Outer membrane protein TolC n=1 Tax=Taibaiella chishuiensis TaxID=1434707 RepID=A0A2P8CVN0_9BACT|nr:TolC family protein [Taibaiella chishuiensis]PSK89022.1 outer membrane protein TolC [Taibaiella chishuiensis]